MKQEMRELMPKLSAKSLISMIEGRIETIKTCYGDIEEINKELVGRLKQKGERQ